MRGYRDTRYMVESILRLEVHGERNRWDCLVPLLHDKLP
jgi:hypothetical protein